MKSSFSCEWLCNPEWLLDLWVYPLCSALVAHGNALRTVWKTGVMRWEECSRYLSWPTVRRILSGAILLPCDVKCILFCLVSSWTFIIHIRTWVVREPSWRQRGADRRKRTGMERGEGWETWEPSRSEFEKQYLFGVWDESEMRVPARGMKKEREQNEKKNCKVFVCKNYWL